MRQFSVPTTALVLVGFLGGCASTGGVPRPFPMPDARPDSSSGGTIPAPGNPSTGAALFDAHALIATALNLQGVPYRNGGSDPKGFDCSGFTQYVFAQHGIALYREAREQFRMGSRVKPADIEAGDLLFFNTVGPGASHVAIAVDDNEFVHAPSSRGRVRVESLSSRYWSRRFIGARRLTE